VVRISGLGAELTKKLGTNCRNRNADVCGCGLINQLSRHMEGIYYMWVLLIQTRYDGDTQ